jgi:hypothetical protein
MVEVYAHYGPWLLSALTVWGMFVVGGRSRNAWLVPLGSQVAWALWIFASETWGMVPGHLALWWVYIRNHRKWAAE